jgi:hypothetical protein
MPFDRYLHLDNKRVIISGISSDISGLSISISSSIVKARYFSLAGLIRGKT